MVQRQTENPGGEGCAENQRETDSNPFSSSSSPPPWVPLLRWLGICDLGPVTELLISRSGMTCECSPQRFMGII